LQIKRQFLKPLYVLCFVVGNREHNTESEQSLVDVTGLSSACMNSLALVSNTLYELNPYYGSLAGNPFEGDDTQ
jgi:hypothetical protein